MATAVPAPSSRQDGVAAAVPPLCRWQSCWQSAAATSCSAFCMRSSGSQALLRLWLVGCRRLLLSVGVVDLHVCWLAGRLMAAVDTDGGAICVNAGYPL